MRVMSYKERISITIDSELLERARLVAEEDDRSLSAFINLALRDYLQTHYPEGEERDA